MLAARLAAKSFGGVPRRSNKVYATLSNTFETLVKQKQSMEGYAVPGNEYRWDITE